MSEAPSARRLGGAFLGLVQGHIELLSHELQEQRDQALRVLLLGGFCLGFAVLLLIGLSALVLIIYWDTHRLAAAIGICAFYAIGMLGAGIWLISTLVNATAPFSASIEELQRDREQLLP